MIAEMRLAKASKFDIWLEDHGMLVLDGHFDYEDGGSQGLGYVITPEFLTNFMNVFGVRFLSRVEGLSCWVVASPEYIMEIHPLHKKDGVPFIIRKT